MAEVVIAIALLAITFVSLLAVLAGGIRTDRKAFYHDAASTAGRAILSRALSAVTRDQPPNRKAEFWAADHPDRSSPYLQGKEVSSDVEFTYEICTETITNPDGTPFGGLGHRLKQVDIFVRWSTEDERAGYGSTVYHDRRILSEASGDPL